MPRGKTNEQKYNHAVVTTKGRSFKINQKVYNTAFERKKKAEKEANE